MLRSPVFDPVRDRLLNDGRPTVVRETPTGVVAIFDVLPKDASWAGPGSIIEGDFMTVTVAPSGRLEAAQLWRRVAVQGSVKIFYSADLLTGEQYRVVMDGYKVTSQTKMPVTLLKSTTGDRSNAAAPLAQGCYVCTQWVPNN
ncbi:MAG: hypothetical protein KM310_02220 [Clostridiales bacterium]|nr:hypothetical protein [Clostridiales bacterium]